MLQLKQVLRSPFSVLRSPFSRDYRPQFGQSPNCKLSAKRTAVLRSPNLNSRFFAVLVVFCLIFSLSVCSSPSGGGKPALTGTVTIDKTSPEVGDTLTAEYEGNGTGDRAWQWLAGGTSIPGANSTTYTVTASDLGKTLAARVSFADQDGTISSAATEAVAETLVANSIEDITELLGSNSGTQSSPLSLKLTIDLGLPSDPESGWRKLLAALGVAGDYVVLDLSACTMTGTIFDNYIDLWHPGTWVLSIDMIVEITLPDVVVSVGESAFYNCDSLTEVNVPKATSIGVMAFGSCASLAEVSFPEARSIGPGAFQNCISLTEVNIPEVTSIGEKAFWYCSLTEVSFPKAISIGPEAFYFCSSLKEVSFPEVTSIGERAFVYCSSLNKVSFPKVTSIGNYAFNGCSSFNTVSFPKARSIGPGAFQNCTLSTVNFPEVTSIGSGAFNWNSLRTITLGAKAPTVAAGIFQYVFTNPPPVTVKIPAGAEGYGVPGTYDETANHTLNWANGFRGKGWNGTGFTYATAATPVILVIEEY